MKRIKGQSENAMCHLWDPSKKRDEDDEAGHKIMSCKRFQKNWGYLTFMIQFYSTDTF